MALDKPLSTVHDPRLPKLQRKDAWWVQPMLTVVILGLFGVYTAWRALENNYPEWGPYLSPMYSPKITEHWMIGRYHFSPAILVLPFPLLFRATCYYYRKAYYRAFFADPASCAVREPFARKNYVGERSGILVLQNIHRYTFYFAAVIMLVLWIDAVKSLMAPGGGINLGLGTLIFFANVVLLSLFTFSCNSWRHLSGGCLNCFSCSAENKTRHTIWQRVTHFNENHALWAWLSLFSVWITDFYVRCLASGVFVDPHIVLGGR